MARVVSEEGARGVDLRAVFNAYDKGKTVSVLLLYVSYYDLVHDFLHRSFFEFNSLLIILC